MNINFHTKLIVLAIFLVAAFFRLYNVNWDSGYHLHPDERFLVMVGDAMKPPTSLADYLNPDVSTFNPVNVGYKFYVYGTFPLALNKLVAQVTGSDGYNGLLSQGRILSAFFDLFAVLYVFKLLFLLKKHHNLPRNIVYLGTILYAIAVLPIQLSHFFAVDTFVNFFLLASFYYLLKFYYEQSTIRFFAGAGLFGLAVASKISAIYIIPLLIFLMILTALKKKTFINRFMLRNLSSLEANQGSISHASRSWIPAFAGMTGLLIFFFLFSYLVLRFADPYYFRDANFLNPLPHPTFIENMHTLKALSNRDAWFPPSVQWLSKTPVMFSIYNLAFYGVGLAYFILIPIGIFLLLQKHRSPEMIALFSWVILFFLYQSSQFTQTMRYFLIIYPFFAFAAATGFHYMLNNSKALVKGIVLALLLFWPLCFLSIYIKPMTRVDATYWISHNIPQGSHILGELWDDGLPLPLPGNAYNIELLPVFDQDTPEKWQKMDAMLQKADYYILSSNRAWGSIPTVPDRYPQMSKFYEDLFAGKLQYKKIKEFTSYPSLSYLGIPITIPDDLADESFTVYDHPKVMIFKNTAK